MKHQLLSTGIIALCLLLPLSAQSERGLIEKSRLTQIKKTVKLLEPSTGSRELQEKEPSEAPSRARQLGMALEKIDPRARGQNNTSSAVSKKLAATPMRAEVYASAEELDTDGKDFPFNSKGVLIEPTLPETAGQEIKAGFNPEAFKQILLSKSQTKDLDQPCSLSGGPVSSLSPPRPPDLQSPLAKSINSLSGKYWAGEVSAAMEAMLMLTGPLSPKEKEAFDLAWAPLFDYPTPQGKAWLNRLTPLVTEFLATQQGIESLLTLLADQRYEAEMAAAYENEEACAELLYRMKQTGQKLTSQKTRLTDLSREIQALGQPPNPMQEKCRARRRAKKLVTLSSLKPKEKTSQPQKNQVDYPLPDYFFKRIPPSTVDFFKKRGMWYWLKQQSKDRDMPKLYLETQLPFKVREDFRSHTEKFYGHSIKWNGLNFSSHMEDPGFKGFICKKGKKGPRQRALYQIQGSISKDGRSIKKLICQITVRFCVSISTDGPDGRSGTADDDFRMEKKVLTRSLTFKDLPLTNASSIIIGAKQRGVILTYGVKGAKETRNHLVDMSKTWARTPPLASNHISLQFTLSQGGPARPVTAKRTKAGDAKTKKIAFHQNNIKWLKKDIAYLYKQLAQAKDQAAIKALYFQLTCKQSDLQGENDAITRIKTGQWVRTPTAWDGMVRAQMAANSRAAAARLKKEESNLKRIDRMIDALPPDQKSTMRNWVRKQLDENPFDQAKQKKVGRIVAQRLQAVNQGIQAKANMSEATAQLGMDVMENYQKAATVAMYATPFVAGGGVLAITYGIASGGIAGYQNGGIEGAAKGAATTALRFWSPKIDYALTFYEGYQEGGLVGGVKNTAITFIQRKAVQKFTQGVMGYQHRAKAAARKAKLDQWKQAQRSHRFKQERQYGKAMVKRLAELQNKYNTAKASGAGKKSLRLLSKRIMDQTAAIKNAPHAKGYLKFNATTKEKAAYGAWDRRHTNKIVRELKQDLARQGFDANELSFKPIRNSGNTSPGMDLDLAMNSTSGNTVRFKDPQTGRIRRLDLYTANAMVQDRFNAVYARNSGGRKASGAWQNVTTSRHLEAYGDTNWLRIKDMQNKGIDPRCSLDPNYAGDAARVTLYKAHEMRRHGGAFTDNQNWEIYRGTSKDIKTKVVPLLKNRISGASNQKTKMELQKKLDFYHKLSQSMDKANRDPVAADREIKRLTGFDTIDTVGMVSASLEALGKW